MCGIVGCRLNRPLDDADLARMRALSGALAHRGPDGDGEFVKAGSGLYLGHRRLSIIDTDSRSDQPMKLGSRVLVYNGELYNYKELKDRLKGRIYLTESDTEVLLHAWSKWGAAALETFDAMFAFALLDTDGTLHLCTDAFGEKPLYLLHRPEGVYFASEAGALIAAFGLAFEPSPEDLSDFLHLGYIRPPSTGYAGLENVKPGRHITIAPDGAVIRQDWHSRETRRPGEGKIEPLTEGDIDGVRDRLCRSLEVRLRADVPLGLFLSGGVDSSLVAALAVRELGVKPESFTVAFPDGRDESAAAAGIARHLGLPHRTVDSADSDEWRDAPAALAALYGVPNDNMTALAVRQMCRAARPFLTVALSGLGGDELFFGYGKYDQLYRRRHLYRNAGLIRPFAAMIPFGKFRRLAGSLTGQAGTDYLHVKNGQASQPLARLAPCPSGLLPRTDDDLAFAVRLFDCDQSLPQSQIPAIERGSMREAVEVRAPFLNRALWDYVSAFDPRSLIAFGPKSAARALLSRYVPLDLLTAGKQGFVFPAARYLSACPARAPAIPGLRDRAAEALWSRRAAPGYGQAALRLAILAAAFGDGRGARAAA